MLGSNNSRVFALVLLAATSPTTAQATPTTWESVRGAFATDSARTCNYQREMHDGDQVTVERFTANATEPWSLLSINGAAPTPKALNTYADNADARLRRTPPQSFDPNDFVDLDSIAKVQETPRVATYTFRLDPLEANLGDLSDALVGELTVVKPNDRATIVIHNDQPIRYAPMVKVFDYTRTIDFEWSAEQAHLVRVREVTTATGKAFGLKTIAIQTDVRYKDLEC